MARLTRTVPELEGSVVTIGVFDGVHLGHQSLLRAVRAEAGRLGAVATVVTFDPYPDEVLTGATGFALTLPEEREKLFDELGIDVVVCLRFDRELAAETPEAFAARLRPLAPRKFLLGPDFAFGRGRSGGERELEAVFGPGVEIERVAPFVRDGVVVSSSLVRELLRAGEVERAALFLGRRYRLSGEVVRGKAKGARLGFPTANLAVDARKLLPGPGVYAAAATVAGRRHAAGVFVPAERGAPVEAHLIGYDGGEFYGAELELEFVARVREGRRFETDAELAAQIAKDVEAAWGALAGELGREPGASAGTGR